MKILANVHCGKIAEGIPIKLETPFQTEIVYESKTGTICTNK